MFRSRIAVVGSYEYYYYFNGILIPTEKRNLPVSKG